MKLENSLRLYKQIFRNVIVSNEFQNIYQNTKSSEHLIVNNEFKLIDFFDDDTINHNILYIHYYEKNKKF